MPKTKIQVHVKPNEEHYGTVEYIDVEKITGNELPVPYQDGVETYTGGYIYPKWINYDKEKMTKSGDTYGVNVGVYTVKFKLEKYQEWDDGTIEDKEVSWIIQKADGYANFDIEKVNDNTYTFNHLYLDEQKDIQIISTSGAITVTGYSSSDVDVSVEEGVIHITPHKLYDVPNLTFQVNVAASDNYNATSYTFYGTVTEHDDTIYGIRFTTQQKGTRTEGAKNFGDVVIPFQGSGYNVGSSPFDNIFPWNKMGVIEHPLGGFIIKIPKFYLRFLVDDGLEIQICKKHLNGFHVSPAHRDRHDGKGERNWVYIGQFYSTSNSGFKSLPNVSLNAANNVVGFDNMRKAIMDLGDSFYLHDFSMYWTLISLYLVEIGYINNKTGGYNIGRSTTQTGQWEDYTYCTGLGKYRNIDLFSCSAWFDNIIDGAYVDCLSSNLYIIDDLDYDSFQTVTGQNIGKINYGGYGVYEEHIGSWKTTNSEGCPIIPDQFFTNTDNKMYLGEFPTPITNGGTKMLLNPKLGSQQSYLSELFITSSGYPSYNDYNSMSRKCLRLMYLPGNDEVDEDGNLLNVKVDLPQMITTTFTYNTQQQSPTYTYDSNSIEVLGDTSATNAGTYTIKFVPKTGFVWPDGTSAVKSYTWRINKAKMTISKSTVDLDISDGYKKSENITISNSSCKESPTTPGKWWANVHIAFDNDNQNVKVHASLMDSNDKTNNIVQIFTGTDTTGGTTVLTITDSGDANHDAVTKTITINVAAKLRMTVDKQIITIPYTGASISDPTYNGEVLVSNCSLNSNGWPTATVTFLNNSTANVNGYWYKKTAAGVIFKAVPGDVNHPTPSGAQMTIRLSDPGDATHDAITVDIDVNVMT